MGALAFCGALALALLSARLALFLLCTLLSSCLRHGLSGRSVLVTGCDSGFGRLAALSLARSHNATVFAGCLTRSGAEALEKDSGGRIVAFVMDVTAEADVQGALELVTQRLEGRPLHAVVNNAGGSEGWLAEANGMEVYGRMVELNLLGGVRVAKAFLPMLAAGRGRLVWVTSALTMVANGGMSAYTAAKWGAEAFCDALRREVRGMGVAVAQVAPGVSHTPFFGKAKASMTECFAAADGRVRERYGGDALLRAMEVWEARTRPVACPPERVAAAICVAVASRFPKDKYLVGLDAWLFWKPVSMMPPAVADWILNAVGVNIRV
ncbi:unnamed protein product [Ostreobium quekettii]|uniref:Uncharacterized protein n=1 Tax=Ostreobium quekettii TaxID=121088 RepID=A0A8S1J905_9CHLO|nr:unnamed protein product [Ostreobium quekettii]|eukprot:evm.model.scf_1369.4 EVM.evm.TU.scf_1369.4   scf_1369:29898-31051(-)